MMPLALQPLLSACGATGKRLWRDGRLHSRTTARSVGKSQLRCILTHTVASPVPPMFDIGICVGFRKQPRMSPCFSALNVGYDFVPFGMLFAVLHTRLPGDA